MEVGMYEAWGIGWDGPRTPVTVGGKPFMLAHLPAWCGTQGGAYTTLTEGPHAGKTFCHGFDFWVPFESELAAEVFVSDDYAVAYLRWAYPRSRREAEEWGPPGPAAVVRVPGNGHRFVRAATWDAEVETWHPLGKTVAWTLGDERLAPGLHGPTEFEAMLEDWSRLGRWRRDK